MLLTLLSASLLFATPPTSIAVTRFKLVQVNADLGGYAEDRLAQRLTARGYQVTTPADLETVLGLERQRQLLGCNDDVACYAELSAALGVPVVIAGRLTKLGNRLELDLRVIRQRDGRVVANDSRGTNDEAKLGDLITEAAEALARQLGAPEVLAVEKPPEAPKEPPKPFRWRLWGPVIGGVLALGGGGVLLGLAQSEYTSWTTTKREGVPLTGASISTTYEQLALHRSLGVGLLGVGAAAIAAGIVWNALTPDAPVSVSVTPAPGGVALSLGGTF